MDKLEQLRETARRIRLRDLETICAAGAGHIGGDMSCIDILTALYFNVLRIDPAKPDAPDRDRFVMSKGHCSAALYTTLAEAGFFGVSELASYMAAGSRLNGHPDRKKVPGVETNTGPLGHGLPVACGAALAAKLKGEKWRVFVLCGDGELQEGSNWEAAMAAAHHNLSRLMVIVDRTGLQQGASTVETNDPEPLADKWRSFGWDVEVVDGHDMQDLTDALRRVPMPSSKPSCVIAQTVKGRGISFMENRAEWHHKVPNAEQRKQAAAELTGAAAA